MVAWTTQNMDPTESFVFPGGVGDGMDECK